MQAVNDPLGLGEGPLLALTVKYLYIKSINHPQEWTTTNGEAGHTYKTEYFHTGYSTNLRASRLLQPIQALYARQKCPVPPTRICLASVCMKISVLNASSGHKPRRDKSKKSVTIKPNNHTCKTYNHTITPLGQEKSYPKGSIVKRICTVI